MVHIFIYFFLFWDGIFGSGEGLAFIYELILNDDGHEMINVAEVLCMRAIYSLVQHGERE